MQIENWTIEELTGYRPVTSLFTDFSAADKIGPEAIQSTYNQAFAEWKDNYVCLTELLLVLNWKIWSWFIENDEYGRLYDRLWKELDAWCIENLKDEALTYYLETTCRY